MLFKQSTLRKLQADGMAILFISHKLDEIRELCDTASVLRGGEVTGRVDPREHDARSLAQLMIGREMPNVAHAAPQPPGAERLRLNALGHPRASRFGTTLDGIDLKLRSGEIVGIAGISGNGQQELAALIEIITEVVEEICAPANQWSVRTVGDLELLGEEPARRLRDAVQSTEEAGRASSFHVNVAVGYGGRQEIVDAVRGLLAKELANGVTGEKLIEAVTAEAISENLYTSGQPDPDLVIRTSGEQRLSGFLLWQSAYSEMWFTEAYWPEFRRVDFLRALRDYSARHRRYGR